MGAVPMDRFLTFFARPKESEQRKGAGISTPRVEAAFARAIDSGPLRCNHFHAVSDGPESRTHVEPPIAHCRRFR